MKLAFFLLNEKRLILFPFTKKETNKQLENYRPVSLLPICEKSLKDQCLTKCLTSLLKINLFYRISPVLNRVILALINCYLSLIRYESFDVGLEVRSVFLDISKAFDKVWHDGIIYKLTQNLNIREFTKPFGRFFKGKKTTCSPQRTSLYMEIYQCWSTILGPFLFLIYINDLTEGLTTKVKLFADDTSLFPVVHDTQTFGNNLSKDLKIINN